MEERLSLDVNSLKEDNLCVKVYDTFAFYKAKNKYDTQLSRTVFTIYPQGSIAHQFALCFCTFFPSGTPSALALPFS